AKRYVERMVASQELTDEQIGDFYHKRYAGGDAATFNLRDAPFVGTPNAPVDLVEFFDYGCPHCRAAAPIFEEVVTQHPNDVVMQWKRFPLRKETVDAAKGALAAAKQGKFAAMHKTLFAHQGSLSREEVFGYAKDIGLDMQKFEKDFNDPATEARVTADKDE